MTTVKWNGTHTIFRLSPLAYTVLSNVTSVDNCWMKCHNIVTTSCACVAWLAVIVWTWVRSIARSRCAWVPCCPIGTPVLAGITCTVHTHGCSLWPPSQHPPLPPCMTGTPTVCVSTQTHDSRLPTCCCAMDCTP